jgi:hypothetical protein
MTAHYYVDEQHDLLIGSVSGLLQVDEIISEANRVFTDTNGAAFMKNHLFVVEPNALSSLIDEEAMIRLRAFTDSWGRKYPGRHIRTAVLVEDGIYKESLFRRWQAIVKDAMHYREDTRIMTDRAEALAWLAEPRSKTGDENAISKQDHKGSTSPSA